MVRWISTRSSRGERYAVPTSSAPGRVSSTAKSWYRPRFRTGATRSSAIQSRSETPSFSARTSAYESSGSTATATFAGRVQGVVVQITRNSFSCLRERELHEDRGVALVPVLDLGVRDRGLAARAPVHDPVPEVEHALLVGALQRPPGGLDVVRGHGLVRVLEVEPDPERAELVGHQLAVLRSEGPALLDEPPDPVVLDLLLGDEAELLLDLDLDREAVHVVPGPVDHVPAPHPDLPEDRVLDDLVPGRAEVDVAGRVRRAVHEEEGRVAGMKRPDLRVDLLLVPEPAHPVLELGRPVAPGDVLHRVPSPSMSGL